MTDPRRESPLHPSLREGPDAHGPAAARFPAVALLERPHLGHYALRGRHRDLAGAVEAALAVRLPETPNTVALGAGFTAAWLSPSEWLLIEDAPPRDGAPGAVRALQDRLAPERSAVVDLSSAQTIVAVGGSGTRDVLSSGCPLDLHPRAFPPGTCAQSHLAKAPVTLLCRGPEPGSPGGSGSGVLDLVVRRSFAPYVWRWLVVAASEISTSIS